MSKSRAPSKPKAKTILPQVGQFLPSSSMTGLVDPITPSMLQEQKQPQQPVPTNQRVYEVIRPELLTRVTGYDKTKQLETVAIDQKWEQIRPMTALLIYQRQPYIFGIVTARANRVSSIEKQVVPVRQIEEQEAQALRDLADLFNEHKPTMLTDPKSMAICVKSYTKLMQHLPDMLPDLSNFEKALGRWYRRVKAESSASAWEIEDWLEHPSPGVTWSSHVKEIVQDLLIHGRVALTKTKDSFGRSGNTYLIPGGTLYPIANFHIGGPRLFVQLPYDGPYGFSAPPQIFDSSEVIFEQYMPNSAIVNGLTPIDAIISQVAETFYFNNWIRDLSDGSRAPEKVIMVSQDKNGLRESMGTILDGQTLTPSEMKRWSLLLNQKARDKAVEVLESPGTATLLDISKADIMPQSMERQEQIKKIIGLVYNSVNLELNETGGDGTSGRNTSESQERTANMQNVRPMAEIIENIKNQEIMERFGYGFKMQLVTPRSDEEQYALAKQAADTGAVTQDEIRVRILNLPAKNTTEANSLPSPGAATTTPGEALDQQMTAVKQILTGQKIGTR